TLLRPDATEKDIEALCCEAIRHNFHAVCINPCFVPFAKKLLKSSGVKVCTVVGFPLGAISLKTKIFEAMEAMLDGADELDMVINIGEARAGHWDSVRKEISNFVIATPRIVHKIIIETCYLTDDEKIRASLTAMDAGAEFIKTSTGFGPAGAVVRDVAMIKETTGGKIGIKASGGIRTLKDVLSFVEAGATRIGTSAGLNIMKEVSLRD
ncbi:MAG TPA: deoxyribose-phosphate aldolase, partial [Nitrospiraceae bacterium]|nr:deoxyribose-phosphate aldolase [Nitrospiraceae bacterium]